MTSAAALKPVPSREPPAWPKLRSGLAAAGVSDDAWTRFVRAMTTQPLHAVSARRGYGCFEMSPRRLVEMGLMENLVTRNGGQPGQVQDGSWRAPFSEAMFLGSVLAQYNTFVDSMRLYHAHIKPTEATVTATLVVPEGMSLAGALAILHRAGTGGLRRWSETQLESTRALFNRANGIF